MLKDKKGISLTTMVIAILVMVIILSTLVYTAYTSIKIRNLNKLYNDLRTLNDEVIIYYAENKSIPADTSEVYATVDETTTDAEILNIVTTDGTFSQDTLVNPNDYDEDTKSATYYKLDLSLFDNISLNYTGTYIINAQSFMIYYVDGLTINGETYYNLPLSYISTNYGEAIAVDKIETETIYLPISDTSVKVAVSDYYTLLSEDGGVPTAKTITYKMVDAISSYSWYFSFDSNTGTITTETGNTAISNSHFSLQVTASNYDSSKEDVTATIDIYLVDIGFYSDADCTTEVSSLTLRKGEIATVYTKLLGYYNSDNKIDLKETKEAIVITTSGTLLNGISEIKISATNTGATTLNATQNTNDEATLSATASLTVNVLNPTLINSNSETMDKLEFTSLNDTQTLILEIEGIDDTDLKINSIDWVYEDSSGNAVNYVTVEFNESTSEVIVTPGSFGTVKLSGTVNLIDENGKVLSMDLDSITISILGVNILKDTLTMEINETATLDIQVASDLNAENVVWSSSDTSVVTINESTGEMTAISNGTSEITASITLTDGTEYLDTCIITVTE